MGVDESVASLAAGAIDRLNLAPEAKAALKAIQAELTMAYQRNFVTMVETMHRQASALDRLQTSLQMLIERVAPEIKDRIPLPMKVVVDPNDADVSAPLVIADPIGAGYTMTQANLSEALGLSQADVSVLVRAFRLVDDGECAVVVRKGKNADTVNYHPRAIQRFRELVAVPPANLKQDQQNALRRVTRLLVLDAPTVTAAPKTSA